jgi:hypothetical protein
MGGGGREEGGGWIKYVCVREGGAAGNRGLEIGRDRVLTRKSKEGRREGGRGQRGEVRS